MQEAFDPCTFFPAMSIRVKRAPKPVLVKRRQQTARRFYSMETVVRLRLCIRHIGSLGGHDGGDVVKKSPGRRSGSVKPKPQVCF
jgi:hypothetical protein